MIVREGGTSPFEELLGREADVVWLALVRGDGGAVGADKHAGLKHVASNDVLDTNSLKARCRAGIGRLLLRIERPAQEPTRAWAAI